MQYLCAMIYLIYVINIHNNYAKKSTSDTSWHIVLLYDQEMKVIGLVELINSLHILIVVINKWCILLLNRCGGMWFDLFLISWCCEVTMVDHKVLNNMANLYHNSSNRCILLTLSFFLHSQYTWPSSLIAASTSCHGFLEWLLQTSVLTLSRTW